MVCDTPLNKKKQGSVSKARCVDAKLLRLDKATQGRLESQTFCHWVDVFLQFQSKTTQLQFAIRVPQRFRKEGKSHPSCSLHLSLGLNTWHADAGELSNAVQASGIILAGHGQAFINVNLTTRASISPAALTLEGALCVHTFPKMLTWVGTCG